MGEKIRPVVIDRHWNVSALLGEAIRLLWRHASLFLPLAAIALVPFLALVHLVWGEDAADWGLAPGSVAGVVVPVLLGWMLGPAICIAFVTVALQRIVDGERPSVAEVVRAAGPCIPATLGALMLQLLAIVFGLVALVVPGVYATALLWFGPQAAAVEARAPADALRRSAALVKGRWGETAGRLLLAIVVLFVGLMPVWTAFDLVEYGVAYAVLDVLSQLLLHSFLGLFGALLFCVLRLPR